MSSAAEEAIESAGGFASDAVRLAMVVSMAACADRRLIRRARSELLAGVDAGAEGDLWLGPLVAHRSFEGIVLNADVARSLQKQLAEDQTLLIDAGEMMLEEHAQLAPSILLEERVTYWSLRLDVSDEKLNGELACAIRAMADPKRRALAIWAARALDRLPERAQRLSAATVLRSAVAGWGEGAQTRARGVKGTMPEWLPFAPELGGSKVAIDLALGGGVLEITCDQSALSTRPGRILAPRIDPLLLELSWGEASARTIELIAPPATGTMRLRVGVNLEVRLSDGTGFAVLPTGDVTAKTLVPVIIGMGTRFDFENAQTIDLDRRFEMLTAAGARFGLKMERVAADAELANEQVAIAFVTSADLYAYYRLGLRHAERGRWTVITTALPGIVPFALNSTISKLDAESVDALAKEIREGFVREEWLSPLDRHVAIGPSEPIPPYVRPRKKKVRRERTFEGLVEDATRLLDRAEPNAAMPHLQRAAAMRPRDPIAARLYARAMLAKPEFGVEVLLEARELLSSAGAPSTADPLTLDLWAAIQFAIFEHADDVSMLEDAIHACERAFAIGEQLECGLRLARLLEERAVRETDSREQSADRVLAERARRSVYERAKGRIDETRVADQALLLSVLWEAAAALGEDDKLWHKRLEELRVPELERATERHIERARSVVRIFEQESVVM